MKDETRNVMVGLTAMAGLAGLALLLVLFTVLVGMVQMLLDIQMKVKTGKMVIQLR